MGSETIFSTAEDRFGRAVRSEREKRGWTQVDLANRLVDEGLRLHPSAIAKIELREVERPRAIRVDEADAIAAVFGLSLDEMVSSGVDLDKVQSLMREIHRAGLELARWDVTYRKTQRELQAEVEKLGIMTRSLLSVAEQQAIEDSLSSRPSDHLGTYEAGEVSSDASDT